MIPIPRALARWADDAPNAAALSCGDETLTRQELRTRSNRLARAYAELGVGAGDLVTIALPNSIEFLVAAVAAWKLGAVPQPVSHRLPLRERRAIVELARSALVVGATPEDHPDVAVVPAGWAPATELAEDDLPEAVSPTWKAPTSGGSTGRPKLILSGDPGVTDPDKPQLLMRPEGVVLIPGPLYHNAGFSMAAWALFAGNHVVVLEHFDAEVTLATIERHGVQWTMLVPTMMSRIWRLPVDRRDAYDLSTLRVLWHMAAPCPAWLKEAWIEWLGPSRIFELYAGTEMQAVTTIRGDQWLTHRGSVGRVVAGEIRILDPEHLEPLPPGEVGEVFMRATGRDTPTYHYVGAEVRATTDGWESLGDMGSMDAEGYLYLADRRADMILSGGANIYPAEVEAALTEHPLVLSCAVVGLPDGDLGSRVHAVVQVADVGAVDADELRRFLGDRLVRYKIPRSFNLTDAVVRDDAGKVRRSLLRDEIVAKG